MTTTTLTEAGGLTAQRVSGHRYRARLIEGDRWGSSGYYSREVLERDGPNVWPAGTQVYLDHPSATEQADRPERSVRDLAGKITSAPVYEADGLYADVEFYPHTAPILEALWDDVGMSIRAAGTAETAERDGRTGPVITSLSEGVSVDVVTRAGAGGKLVAMIESARAGGVSEALPGGLVANDLERRLEDAVGPEAIVHDYTDEWVVFSNYRLDERVLQRQAYTADDTGRVTLTGEPEPVARRVTYDVMNPPSTSAGVALESTTREDPTMGIQIDEAEHQRLTETAQRVTAMEAERDAAITERDEARSEVEEAHRLVDESAVERVIAAAGVEFTALEAKGLRADKPLTEAGRLDVPAFEQSVKEAAAEKANATGAGRPTDLGGDTGAAFTEADLDRELGITTTKIGA